MPQFAFGVIFAVVLAIAPELYAAKSACPTSSNGPEATFECVRQDLRELRQLKFRNVSVNHLKFFGSADADDIVRFFLSRVQKVSAQPALAYALAQADGRGTIYLNSKFFESRQAVRWATLIHEARHNEADGSRHVDCSRMAAFRFESQDYPRVTRGDPHGGSFCDWSDQGAYAVDYTFLVSIAESCTNCPRQMMLEAAGAAIQTLVRIRMAGGVDRLVRDSSSTTPLLNFSNNIPAFVAWLDAPITKKKQKRAK